MQEIDGLCHCGCGEKTKVAPRTSSRYGWIKGHPLPYLRGHAAWKDRGPRWVEDPNGCWIWQRSLNNQGYPIGTFARFGKKTALAHRVMYEQQVGPIPQGLELDHTCRVPACVNPSHLEPVTQRENIHRQSKTKLRDEDVAAAYLLRLEGKSWPSIAEPFGVSRTRLLTRVREYCERTGLPYR